MKLRYYLRGLGIGVTVTAIIMNITAKPEELTDAQIKIRAAQLGMVEQNVLADLNKSEEVVLNNEDTEKESMERTTEEKVSEETQEETTMEKNDSNEKITGKTENPVSAVVPVKSLVDYPQLPHPGNLRRNKITATDVFSHFELYQAKVLPELLEYRIFSYNSISKEIREAVYNYRPGEAPVDPIFPMSRILSCVRATGKAEEDLLKSRQQYWRKQTGAPEELIRKMLTEDPVMQMAAINMLLEKFCRLVLDTREYEGKFDQTVWHLVHLQNELLDKNK